MSSFRLRIANARQIVQVCANGEPFKSGAAQKELAVLENASLVVDQAGRSQKWLMRTAARELWKDVDARGMVVLPGFVDAHTHPVWSGNRVNEFAMKLAGATYMEVHESGGGINNTVRHTKKSSEAELLELLRARLDRMLRSGTTLIEAKSGYGLETDTELKMLRVLHTASTGDNAHPVEIVSNYLGGHSVPDGMTAAEATEDIKDGTISPEFIDVFCEKGVFEHDASHRILEAGKKAGLEINFHGDEMYPMQSGTMAAALGARAISHCEMLTAEDLQAMAAHKPEPVFAVLLPTTNDYNPNAHCLSMALTMNMACVQFGMTMKEALLEVGKQGDLVLMRATQWEQIIYEMGDPPIEHVVKKGIICTK
ncbi:Metal-dependent hydrolase [Phytophthora cactorum]|nr:Metal-dependent hydrolase [Phytophthora cactorum]